MKRDRSSGPKNGKKKQRLIVPMEQHFGGEEQYVFEFEDGDSPVLVELEDGEEDGE